MSAFPEAALNDYVTAHLPHYTQQLCDLIRIPSISQRTEHAPDTQKVLEAINHIVSGYGFKGQILQTRGLPAYTAILESGAEQPWVYIYNHMDVQPADEPQWQTKPFDPVIEGDQIFGRGSTDDKGPALSIIHALHFLKQQGLALPNIRLLYETEEEIGSPHFGECLDQYSTHWAKPTSILVSDTIFEGDYPAITYQLRGLLQAQLELTTGSKDLHSGIFGGAVCNPLNILVNALAQCVDSQGKVLIPGFYEGIRTVQGRELSALQAVSAQFNIEKFQQDAGGGELYTDSSLDLLQRLWTLPTFEIHGFVGGQSQPGPAKSALPYQVSAKLTMRLVPGQNPADILAKLKAHLQQIDPRIQVTGKGGVPAATTDLDNPFMAQAKAACEYGFGLPALFVGGGGTIGSIPEFQRVFPEAPIVLLAQSLLSDGYHAPNENFRLSQARNGMKTMAYYLHHIANLAG